MRNLRFEIFRSVGFVFKYTVIVFMLFLQESDPKKCYEDKFYSLIGYIGYIYYPPLYIAGPIITYNNFLSSAKGDAPKNSLFQKFNYGLRAFGCFLSFEIFLHYFYVHAIAKNPSFFPTLLKNPMWCAIFGYMSVNFLYLKFQLLWRFHRFWAINVC